MGNQENGPLARQDRKGNRTIVLGRRAREDRKRKSNDSSQLPDNVGEGHQAIPGLPSVAGGRGGGGGGYQAI